MSKQSTNPEKANFPLIIIVLGTLSPFLSLWLQGFVLHFLWLWFIVPLNFPSITIFQASGIILTTEFLKAKSKAIQKVSRSEDSFEEDIKNGWQNLNNTFKFCRNILALGFILYIFS